MNSLQSQVDDLTSQLSAAHSEIKALQSKLAAARNATASNESVQSKVPGSTTKSAANRNAVASNAEAVQIAQLKEDLYSDLTGLIIRSVKKRESDHLYDCIQTGINGSESFSQPCRETQPADQYPFQRCTSNLLFPMTAMARPSVLTTMPSFITCPC